MCFPDVCEFSCPLKICSGQQALDHLPFELGLLGSQKPLVVGYNEQRCLQPVINAFQDSGLTLGILDDLPDRIDLQTVRQAAKYYHEYQHDAIIAIGSKGVADLAKIANLAVSEQTEHLEQFAHEGAITKPLKPLITVLTCSGTGLETTPFATIQEHTFSSHFLRPQLVIIDPRMVAVDHLQTSIALAMTALAHAVEAYIQPVKHPGIDLYALPAIQLICEHLPQVIAHPDDQQGCLALVNAVCMSGCTVSPTSPGILHLLGQAVRSMCHLPLGIYMGILLPYVVEYNM